ncbi:S41 family peptidase [Pedobacter panaciterrae]|uniref:S41 family peptidase n=1 Tax=Pedobacter panaciterrae TaxID=363849 RepID=A0ABU8NRX5_9SPHI|nr:S41 family peptidase [uncultured Pedobacter sp.]
MKIIQFITVLLCLGQASIAQKIFTKSELKKDFSIIRAALQEAHPGLYRYRTKQQITTAFEQTESRLNKDMTELEFYRIVNPMIAYLADGHTKFHRQKRPDDHFAFFEQGYFPLKLHFRKDKAYILKSFSDPSFPYAGCELKSINGKAISEIKSLLFQNIFSDADGETFKYQELNQTFSGYYAEVLGDKNVFDIQLIDKTGKPKGISVRSAAATAFPRFIPLEPIYSLIYPSAKVALMRIPVFQEKEGLQKYEDFLASAFKNIKDKSINSLIIDLRDNEGGTDAFGFKLYAYLTAMPFRYYDRFTVAGKPDYSFSEYAWLPPELAYLKQFIVKKGNEYLFTQKEGLGLQTPQPNPYTGKLIVLVNGRSFSVTSEFAAIVKDNRRAMLVGEETGGGYTGNSSGGFAMVTLPNTKLGLDVPLLGYYMHLKNPTATAKGVPVELNINPTIQQILTGEDVVLRQALILAKSLPKSQ